MRLTSGGGWCKVVIRGGVALPSVSVSFCPAALMYVSSPGHYSEQARHGSKRGEGYMSSEV